MCRCDACGQACSQRLATRFDEKDQYRSTTAVLDLLNVTEVGPGKRQLPAVIDHLREVQRSCRADKRDRQGFTGLTAARNQPQCQGKAIPFGSQPAHRRFAIGQRGHVDVTETAGGIHFDGVAERAPAVAGADDVDDRPGCPPR